jgi:8-oxo-dGTP diphosphatase
VHYTEYDTRLAAYAAIIDDRGQVLLALWNEASEPLWTMPGGGVELDETPEDGVVREVREETGYDVVLERLLGIDSFVIGVGDRPHVTDRPLKNLRLVYEARVVGGELRNEVDGTTDEARWFPLERWPRSRGSRWWTALWGCAPRCVIQRSDRVAHPCPHA